MGNNDAETLIMPQVGGLNIRTECGELNVGPLELALIPRGMVYQVELEKNVKPPARGYVLENFGAFLALPELGPIGISSGLAHTRHFLAPHASFDESSALEQGGGGKAGKTGKSSEFFVRYQDRLYHGVGGSESPLDVVSWYGNHVPLKYDLRDFMAINTVTYDHPDPCIGAVLTSPAGGHKGVANIDFVVFPPRYVVSENTFRPPWFHRNWMSEFMGLIAGAYDAKAGFLPGAVSIHNQFCAHGPDKASVDKGSSISSGSGDTDATKPERYAGTMAFMWETDKIWRPTRYFMESLLDKGYRECWRTLENRFDPINGVPDDPTKYPFDGKWRR